MARGLYFAAGALSLIVGCIGIFLPLLPTTPFLLLSSYCFVRSSPAAHRWLLNHRWLGGYLRDWEHHRGVRRSVKVLAVLMVGAVVAAGLASSTMSPGVRIALLVLAATGLLVVWRLPVITAEASKAAEVPTAERVKHDSSVGALPVEPARSSTP